MVPTNALLSARSVDDAAVMVMLPDPLNDTPLMRRPVWRTVAVPALPEMEPVMRLLKVSLPEKVLLSARRVEDAMPEIAPHVTLPLTTFRAFEVAQLPVARKRLVVEAVVAKSVVVVAFVVVLFKPVKFWRVDDAVARKLAAWMVVAAVREPVKLAALLIV